MIVKTCKGCKFKGVCNGRIAKNSMACESKRSLGNTVKKGGFWSFLRNPLNRKLTRQEALQKYQAKQEKVKKHG